ncbi:MAG: hypothetical protein C6P35_17685 [Cohnella sp.]|uniref:hypothetical protein n=1 Tax=Cohnella sp. TaxID=1883426 RepID=UPI000E37932A|nr:hypothetical protein [Cohnella sp.]REK61089.1 MAG: hypothetical protein C6P35_17685 [Cohnella sp.]
MERLIDFIVDNYLYIAVVVGILYTLFFRQSPLEKNPPGRMPDFGGGGGLGRPHPPQRPSAPKRPRQHPAPAHERERTPGGPMRPSSPAPAPLPQTSAPGERPHPAPDSPPVVQLPARPPAAPSGDSLGPADALPAASAGNGPGTHPRGAKPLSPSARAAGATPASAPAQAPLAGAMRNRPLRRDELKRAIVWAEILGQPRARRPFGGRRT